MKKSDIPIVCRGCHKEESDTVQPEMRYDYYGIHTGYYCDDCYDHHYPYKRGAYYDFLDAGEYLDDNY